MAVSRETLEECNEALLPKEQPGDHLCPHLAKSLERPWGVVLVETQHYGQAVVRRVRLCPLCSGYFLGVAFRMEKGEWP